MRRLSWLLCGFVCMGGGLLCVLLLAPGLLIPLSWGWNSGSYGWGAAPLAWGGLGWLLVVLGMFALCALMMGGMMLRGQHWSHGAGSRSIPWLGESNFDILQRRYSQGDITQEQFEEMKRDLDL
jgi:uncharacterized membrane protein